MPILYDVLPFLLRLVERGGPVVLAVLAMSLLMWTLIVERIWFLHRRWPRRAAALRSRWDDVVRGPQPLHQRYREVLLTKADMELKRHLAMVRALTTILPLLGLLGTITGMIATFDGLTLAEGASPRQLSGGIDSALISTLAGLATAITGLYCSTWLENRAAASRDALSAALV